MAGPVTARKKRFRMALASAGITQSGWARREGITPAYLSNALNGNVEPGKRLLERIDRFTDRQLRKAGLTQNEPQVAP